jgi:hypothetical protein
MLHFDKLSILDTHIAFLQKKTEKDAKSSIKNFNVASVYGKNSHTVKKQNTLFLVGGCIRDLLL